jgi:3-methyladenine DNA glycosylase AlkD
MTFQETLSELERSGTEQNRKVYRRHGVGSDLYGVSYATQKALKKAIKVDHDLACRLWATGNHDARILATMIADPKRADATLVDAWVRDLDNYVITDAFTGFVVRTAEAAEKMEPWMCDEGEWVGRAGWMVLAHRALHDDTLDDVDLAPYVPIIERDIHAAKNRIKDAMNAALIAIGMRSDMLEGMAVSTAGRIGKVDVDHGETNCKTPDVAAYIRKGRSRKQKTGA